MLDASDSRLLRELHAKINAEVAKIAERIVAGQLIDHTEYVRLCAQIKGMRDALAYADEIETKINGD